MSLVSRLREVPSVHTYPLPRLKATMQHYPPCQWARDGALLQISAIVAYRYCTLNKYSNGNVLPSQCVDCQNGSAPTEPQSEPPSLQTRLVTWAEACANWALAGSPTRSQDEIDRIYKYFCEPCHFRIRSKNVCLVCGCRVDTYGYAIFNKIKMATEHCPKGKW